MNKLVSYLFVVCCISVFFSCQKEISQENNVALTAAGSLWDSTGSCLPDSVHGTFYGGITPGSDTAYVEVQVNVTQTGSYSISSDFQDGFEFVDSGFFSSTGINTIRLKPVGTPIIPTTSTFNISFDSSFCSFVVNIEDSTGKGLGGQKDTVLIGGDGTNGQWQFTANTVTYKGAFNKTFSIDTLGYKYVYLLDSTNGFDSAFYLFISFPGGTITPGTYNIQASAPSLNGFQFDDVNDNVIYIAITDSTSSATGTVTVTSYDSVTNTISGTFSGNAEDANFNPGVNVTNGSFTATVSP